MADSCTTPPGHDWITDPDMVAAEYSSEETYRERWLAYRELLEGPDDGDIVRRRIEATTPPGLRDVERPIEVGDGGSRRRGRGAGDRRSCARREGEHRHRQQAPSRRRQAAMTPDPSSVRHRHMPPRGAPEPGTAGWTMGARVGGGGPYELLSRATAAATVAAKRWAVAAVMPGASEAYCTTETRAPVPPIPSA
jgi:hypothetical protein